VGFQIIIDDSVERGVSDCRCYLFATLNALLFFMIDELCEATSTESVIAGLNCNWNGNDFETKSAGYLIF